MTPQTVPVAQIVVGANPRTFFDPDDQKQLERSIEVFGLLTPIAVEQIDADSYQLIVGERRLRAFQNLGIEQIPAQITTVADHAGAAIAENVVRVNLHPIEEGRAYLNLLKANPKKQIRPATLAKQLGIPAKRIVERLRLAQIPADLADAMIAGARIDRIRDLICDFVEKFGVEITSAFVESHLDTLNELQADDGDKLHEAFADWLSIQSPQPVAELGWNSWQALPEETLQELRELAGTKVSTIHQINALLDLRDISDEDAANAYGCLVVFKGDDVYSDDITYVTDIAWMADRIRYNIEQLPDHQRPAVEAPTKRIDAETGEVIAPTAEELAAEDEERKKQKRAEAAAAKAEREERGRINQAFGVNLTRKLSKRKLTHADSQLIAEMVLEGETNIALAWDLVKEPAEQPTGTDKFQRARALQKWVTKGKNAEEVIGRLLQVLLVAAFVDKEAVVKSRRPDVAFYSAHLTESDHLLTLLQSIGPDELSQPWIEAQVAKKERERKWDADRAREAAEREEQRAKALAAKAEQEPVTAADDSEPDPTTEPTVTPEEADEPLLSEQAAIANALAEAPDDDTPGADYDDEQAREAQIQELAEQSRAALAAELDRAEQEAS